MNKHTIHTTPEELMAAHTAAAVRETAKVAAGVKETTEAVQQLGRIVKDKAVEIAAYSGLLKAAKHTNTVLEQMKADDTATQKMEEIKSAALVTNRLLKELVKKETPPFPEIPKVPEFPEIPKTDLTETNKLLARLLTAVKEKEEEKITVSLKLV